MRGREEVRLIDLLYTNVVRLATSFLDCYTVRAQGQWVDSSVLCFLSRAVESFNSVLEWFHAFCRCSILDCSRVRAQVQCRVRTGKR